jgi:hypothetical protein
VGSARRFVVKDAAQKLRVAPIPRALDGIQPHGDRSSRTQLASAQGQRRSLWCDLDGWKVARLFSRLDARVFRPAMAMFTGNDAVLPFPLRSALDRADAQLDALIYQAFPLPTAV